MSLLGTVEFGQRGKVDTLLLVVVVLLLLGKWFSMGAKEKRD